MSGTRLCACKCGETLPAGADRRAKYVNETHRRRMESRRRRERLRDKNKPRRIDAKPTEGEGFTYTSKAESADGRASARRGQGYERFVRTDWPALLARGEVKQAEVMRALDESQANISRWMAAYHEDQALGLARENHEPDLSHTDDLGSFTRRYFPKLKVPGFHLEWEQAIDETVGTGNKLLLLASQRHGKSEMLIRYCMKRIAQDPNIRILWVSKTQALAERMVGYVRQNLEHNEAFITDVLGSGQTFMPPTRSGLSWTNSEFTIGCRTEVRKTPTMVALGVGGTIVGLDADLIILDDPQDRARCLSPSQREKDIEWLFTDFLSRKEEDTGVAFIMSRQHVQDLPGVIIQDHDDWRVLVYRAHDPACTIPEVDEHGEAHPGHVDCVLWPEMRSWPWLLQQKGANEAHFQRNYMNDPKTDNTILVSAADLDRCKDRDRVVGNIPKGASRLIAGIDPADAKPVAAVLWAHELPSDKHPKGRRHVVDIMEAEAGVRGGREILRKWREDHGCTLFVVEKNIAQSWWQDRDIRDICSSKGISLKEHYTSASSKWNDATGVVAMFSRMRTDPPTITIPWGDRASQQKMDRLLRTFLLFDPDYAGHKHADDDLPMAAWFPQPTMDSWINTHTSNAVTNYRQTPYVPSRTPYVSQHRHLRLEPEVA